MQLQFYRPRHPQLSAVMEGYYFLDGNGMEDRLSYYTFPNNFLIVSVLEQAQILQTDNHVYCRPSVLPSFQSNLTYNYTVPIFIDYAGQLNELTVYFKPLGLHAFLEADQIFYKESNFGAFNPFPDFRQVMTDILRLQDREQQVILLEDYWLSKKRHEPEPLLTTILKNLEEGDAIAEIAKSLSCSRQYFSRLFLQHFGKAPSTYRKIHRFRSAIAAKGNYGNLTALGYGNAFYDQSHFIRDFRKLTALSPKLFFDRINTQNNNLWLYV